MSSSSDGGRGSMSSTEFLDHIESEDEKLGWFLRNVREEYENGKAPAEIADELYYHIESSPAEIEYHLVMSVLFGVLWEKEDAEARQE